MLGGLTLNQGSLAVAIVVLALVFGPIIVTFWWLVTRLRLKEPGRRLWWFIAVSVGLLLGSLFSFLPASFVNLDVVVDFLSGVLWGCVVELDGGAGDAGRAQSTAAALR